MSPSWSAGGETQHIPATTYGPLPGYLAAPEPGPRHARVGDATPVSPPLPAATGEPVIISHAVTIVLAALVTAGWITIPSPVIDTVGSVVALAVSLLSAVLARSKVTPLNGGMWPTIAAYVADLVQAELARQRTQP